MDGQSGALGGFIPPKVLEGFGRCICSLWMWVSVVVVGVIVGVAAAVVMSVVGVIVGVKGSNEEIGKCDFVFLKSRKWKHEYEEKKGCRGCWNGKIK